MNITAQLPFPADTGRGLHLLVVEDHADILANVHAYLEPLGYVIDSARTGPAGLAQAASGRYDLVVLDLMLPGMDGIAVCRALRRTLRTATPVLILTARDTVQDKVAGFDAGADDYLVKPFSMQELDVRLRALHRRARGHHLGAVLEFGELRLDLRTHAAARAGQPLRLTPTGIKLLAILMRVAPQVVSRAELERELWGDSPPTSDALRTHIHALRLELDRPFPVPLLRTLPGIGYCLGSPHGA
jgi:DNA-binding response OmpR family regulator